MYKPKGKGKKLLDSSFMSNSFLKPIEVHLNSFTSSQPLSFSTIKTLRLCINPFLSSLSLSHLLSLFDRSLLFHPKKYSPL